MGRLHLLSLLKKRNISFLSKSHCSDVGGVRRKSGSFFCGRFSSLHGMFFMTQLPTVLLVEDYTPSLLLGSMMLEHLGYAVETASCGKEAIEKVACSTPPFLAILMDMKMYDMTGAEATSSIRQLDRERGMHHTIIAVTAHALTQDRERCLDAGMDDYISTPIHPDILAQKLSALVNSPQR